MTKIHRMIMLLLLASCGRIGNQDPQFAKYLGQYAKETKARGVNTHLSNLDISFGNLPDGVAGQCQSGERIIISDTIWPTLDESVRMRLLFHELGHCDLNRKHVVVTRGGCPTSIMAPALFGERCWDLMGEKYYLDELFGVSK